MTWLAIKLFLGRAWGAVRGFITRYPWQAALVLALLWGAWERNGKQGWRDAFVAQKAAYVAAQNEAKAKAIAARLKHENQLKDIAHEADRLASNLDADSRRNLADRVRREAPRCAGSAAATPAVPDGSPVDTGADPGSVSFTLAEADALRRHEVRSSTCSSWARSLIDSGLAVPSD